MEGDVEEERANYPALRGSFRRWVEHRSVEIAGFEPLLDQLPTRHRADGREQKRMVDVVKGTLNVRIHDPLPLSVWGRHEVDHLDGIVAAPSRTESVAGGLEPGLPRWFQRILHHRLERTVADRRNAQWPEVAILFGDVDPSRWVSTPWLVACQLIDERAACRRCLDEDLIDSRGSLA
jgi:hypothetical protein